MKEEILTEALLRQFLLGKVDDEQRERIENLFLTDSQARERILVAEQDLIEDYLEDNLTDTDKEIFLSQHAQTSVQQRVLQINRSIKDWARKESAAIEILPVKTSAWVQFREWLRLRPAALIPIAVAALILIAVAAVWLSSRRQRENRRYAIEQELAQLNNPTSLRQVPPDMSSLELSRAAVRSDEQQDELKKTAEIQVVELQLPWIQKERYSNYRVEVRRVGSDELFTIPPVQADNESRIRIRLAAHLLHRGHYRVSLTGISPDGSAGLTEDYAFAVTE